MIRVLHVTEDHSVRNTGISSAVDALTRCVPEEIMPAIFTTGADPLPLRPGVELHAFPVGGFARAWRYAPGAEQALAKAIAAADVVHLHGLWMWVQWAAAHMALRLKKPFVLTAHGMLEPWISQRQAWPHRLKKFLYWNTLAYPAFHRASALHALTSSEDATLAAHFPGRQAVVIPHGIDLSSIDTQLGGLPPQDHAQPPYFLFLGRLHPVKAIHLLIRAFARLPGEGFMLKIAGPTQPQEQAYAASLHQLVSDLGLAPRVVFTGAVHGDAKWQLYRDAWTFCLPSFSEVIGMVNLEAAAAGTPVITSYESGVVEDWERCGGLRVHPDEESILAALQQAQAWSPVERTARGQTLRALVESQYSWQQVGQQWAALYQRLCGGEPHA